jgi:phosphotransferase system HPr (HPr) family protein
MNANSHLVRREVEILNELGLYTSPAGKLVRWTKFFHSQIWIIKGEERFSVRSIMEVLTASLNCGSTAVIEAKGQIQKAR